MKYFGRMKVWVWARSATFRVLRYLSRTSALPVSLFSLGEMVNVTVAIVSIVNNSKDTKDGGQKQAFLSPKLKPIEIVGKLLSGYPSL